MKLETKRLILRKPKLSDWEDMVEGLNDLEVSKNLKYISYPYNKKEATKSIKYALKEWKKKEKWYYMFLIELKSEKKVIGSTGLYEINKEHSKCTTGSWINKKYWRKGYILEAKVPVLDLAFNKLKFRKIETSAYKENKASNNMSKKLGFKFEGVKKKSQFNRSTGKIHDSVIYGLLKENWKKRRPKIVKEVNRKIKARKVK